MLTQSPPITLEWGDMFETRFDLDANKKAKALLTSDWHWDNPKCDRGLMKEQFQEAVLQNAAIFSFGDQFCAMQGRYDPRRSRMGIRPEHDTKHYLDSLVDGMTEWLLPYKEHLQFVCDGNHELSIQKNCETDILGRVVSNLIDEGSNVKRGNISGWIRLKFQDKGDRRRNVTKLLGYHHGAGGGGEVTKGTIKTARRAAYRGQADILCSGHIHDAWVLPIMQERVSIKGMVQTVPQMHVSIPTYKDEYDLSGSGYHMLNERHPRATGAIMMEAKSVRGEQNERDIRLRFTPWLG